MTSDKKLAKAQLAILYAFVEREITQNEATARMYEARGEYLRRKALWHILRAGNGGSRLLAEQYTAQSQQEDVKAAEFRRKEETHERQQPES